MKSNKLSIALLTLGIAGLLVLAGYLWGWGPEYGEIGGRVTRGGVPLKNVQVVFYPEAAGPRAGPRSLGFTDADGRFETMTDKIQDEPARNGAPVGKYRVALVDVTDQFRQAEMMSTRPGGPDPKQRWDPAGAPEKPAVKNNLQLVTASSVVEIKPGKNWFDMDVK